VEGFILRHMCEFRLFLWNYAPIIAVYIQGCADEY